MKRNVKSKPAHFVPPEILEILGPAPVLNEQEEKIYHAMLARFAKEIAPTDLTSWLMVNDLAHYRLEIIRYRFLKAAALRLAQARQVGLAISRLRTDYDKEALQLQRQAQEKCAKEVDSIEDAAEREKGHAQLKEKLEADVRDAAQRCITAQDALGEREGTELDLIPGFAAWSPQHEKLDSFLEIAERGFNTTRRELEKHLDGFGRSLRANLDNVIEGEASEIESSEVESDEVPLSPVASKDDGA